MTFKPYPKYKESGIPWLPRVPEGWSVSPLKWLVTQLNEKPEPGMIVGEYIGMENIESFSGKWIPGSSNDDSSGLGNLFEDGDVLFGKLRPYLAKAWYANRSGICSSELLVLRPRTIDGQFLLRQVLNQEFITLVDSSTYGSKMPRASWDFIGAIQLPVPPRDEQEIIAAFLDRETAKIDTLISKQEKLIELLKEKRQAVISHAVTKGIDPTVPMKPSGVEWLGDVPKHWTVSRLKHVCEVKGRIGFRGYTVDDLVDEDKGAIVIGATEMKQDGSIDLSDCPCISWEKYYESPEIMITKGDILFVQRGSTVGKAAIVDRDIGDATINPSLVLLKEVQVPSDFLLYWLMSATIKNIVKVQTSSTAIPMISQQQIGNYPIPLPAPEEMTQIAAYVNDVTRKIDALIEKAEQAIELQKEHRAALISAAVTGKIDVREHVSDLQEAA